MEILDCRFGPGNRHKCKKNVNGKCLCPKRDTMFTRLCERYKEKECPLWNYDTSKMRFMDRHLTEADLGLRP